MLSQFIDWRSGYFMIVFNKVYIFPGVLVEGGNKFAICNLAFVFINIVITINIIILINYNFFYTKLV